MRYHCSERRPVSGGDGTLAAVWWGPVAAERDRTRGGTSEGGRAGHVTVEGEVIVLYT
jgi:hypothetical protein